MPTSVDSRPPGFHAPTPSPQTPANASPVHRTPRILCADDSPLMREVYAHVLGRMQLEFELAADGRAALRCFAASPDAFALVITDHEMPFMTGREFVGQLRCLGYQGPVCVASALDRRDTEQIYRDVHVDVVLQKPMAFEDLTAVVARLLR